MAALDDWLREAGASADARAVAFRDGWVSVRDLLRLLGFSQPTAVLRRLCAAYAPLRESLSHRRLEGCAKIPALHADHLEHLREALSRCPFLLKAPAPQTEPLALSPEAPRAQVAPVDEPARRRPRAVRGSKAPQLALRLSGEGPFGWRWAEGEAQPIPEEQQVLRRIRKAFAFEQTPGGTFAGSARTIAQQLNRDGLLRRGYPWNEESLEAALTLDEDMQRALRRRR